MVSKKRLVGLSSLCFMGWNISYKKTKSLNNKKGAVTMMKSRKKSDLNISEKTVYLLLVLVIIVSVLGTLLVVRSIDHVVGSTNKIIEHAGENQEGTGANTADLKTTGHVSVKILSRPGIE